MKQTLEIKYNREKDEHFIEFTPEMLHEVGWKEGDIINWNDNCDGSFTLTKLMSTNILDLETTVQFLKTFSKSLEEKISEGIPASLTDRIEYKEIKEANDAIKTVLRFLGE